MTQTEKVLCHIINRGSITPLEAMKEYGIMRLGARVHDIRAAGIPIKSEIVVAKNADGKPVHYAKYYMEGD